jgi:hypothetical protein
VGGEGGSLAKPADIKKRIEVSGLKKKTPTVQRRAVLINTVS